MRDRYGNSVTTPSSAAFDAYCTGVDHFLAAQAGGIEALQLATELDPEFSLAHADLARALQIVARPNEARVHMALALEHSDRLSAARDSQELEHISIMGLLVGGKSVEAFDRIQAHILSYPRDVLTVQPCCGVFGLIGFSGRAGREQENADFMATLHKHYAGDWWFESQYAFALCETGDLDRAETLNELAYAANPRNANAVHHRAHIHYETGEFVAGRKALREWRMSYARDGILHCHLAWHDALWALAARETEALWNIVASDILPEVTSAPPINVLTDLIAVLMRAQLAGAMPPAGLWGVASDYAQANFPRPGVSFVDAHSVLAFAFSNNTDGLAALENPERGWAADLVGALGRACSAFSEQAWSACVDELEPVIAGHERLGGSRAQRDLFELIYCHAQLQLGQEPRSARVRPFV